MKIFNKGNEKGLVGALVRTVSGAESCCAPGEACCGPSSPVESDRGKATKNVKIYDPPMCCSTGVCGPEVDPALVSFAADLKWLESQGLKVERFNLAQSPMAFVENDLVRSWLEDKGEKSLPLVVVEDKVVASGTYPSRNELVAFLGLNGASASQFTPEVAELVAIGAAIASNCLPCLRHHVKTAIELGVTPADIAYAVDLAAKVKDAPHRAVLQLAARLTHAESDVGTDSED